MESTVDIRAMTLADLDDVCAMEVASQSSPWSRTQFEAELAAPHARCTVALMEGTPVGFLVAWQLEGELEVQSVATAPAHRRCGAAKALVAAALAAAREEGTQHAFLEVRAGNLPAIMLYRRFGFIESGRRPRYYPDGEDALLMTCPLAGEATESH